MTTVEHTMADAAAMRRALELADARPGARRQPARRVRDPLPARRRARRGLAPRSRHRPRRGRRALEARAGCRSRARPPSSRSSRATTRVAPARAPSPSSTPASAGSSTRSPTRATTPAGGAERLRDAGVEVTGGVLADEVEAVLDDWLVRRPARPAPRDREVGGEPRRPRRGIRRHEPVDHRPRRARRRAPTPRRGRRDRGRHRHRARRRPGAHGPRPRAASSTTRSRCPWCSGDVPCPPTRRSRGIRTRPSSSRAADLAADLRDLQRRGIRSLFVEGGPTLASAFLAAGLVDELLVYLAPVLLGGPRLAVGDLGIAHHRRRPALRHSPPSSGSATTCSSSPTRSRYALRAHSTTAHERN